MTERPKTVSKIRTHALEMNLFFITSENSLNIPTTTRSGINIVCWIMSEHVLSLTLGKWDSHWVRARRSASDDIRALVGRRHPIRRPNTTRSHSTARRNELQPRFERAQAPRTELPSVDGILYFELILLISNQANFSILNRTYSY